MQFFIIFSFHFPVECIIGYICILYHWGLFALLASKKEHSHDRCIPSPGQIPAGTCSQARWHALWHGARGPRAWCPRMCPLAVPPAMVLLHMANVAVGMFLGCLLSHPLLNGVAVRADTDPPVLDVEDDRRQVTVPVSSLDATHAHSVQEPPGNVMGNRSAAAGGDGEYGC